MITKYAVLNPMSGEYTKVDSEEKAKELATKNIIEFYKTHLHGQLYNLIRIDEQGDEIWESINNETELPAEYLNKIESIL